MAWYWPERGRCTVRHSTRVVRHTAAAEAVRVIEAETLAAQYGFMRSRTDGSRALEQALAEVAFTIEQLERADAARLRLTARSSLPSAGR